MSSNAPASETPNPFTPGVAVSNSQIQIRRRVPIGILIVLWGIPAVIAAVASESIAAFMFSRLLLPALCGLTLLIWWCFRSHIPGTQRALAVAAALAALGLPFLLSHKSVNFMVILMYGVPYGTTAACLWLAFAGDLNKVRTAGLMAISILTIAALSSLRVHGVTGEFQSEFDWRWNPSPEERLLAKANASAASNVESAPPSETSAWTLQPTDWAEFRGSVRDGSVVVPDFQPDWKSSPPKQLWRQSVGPGWSSFCVVDGHVITQEQLGENELIICRNSTTGDVVWKVATVSRFEEPVAGAGPRGTPTFVDGKLYVQGASGDLLCLEAATGREIWKRNVVKETGAKIPEWGFSASPLVHNGQVTTFAGADGKGLITFDANSGEVLWTAACGKLSYCSPQISSICNEEQMLFCSDTGLIAVEPATGKVLWSHEWPTGGIARITQPAVLANADGTSDVLIGTGLGVGLRRIHVSKESDAWKISESWTTTRCKPYFNDFVIHEGHLYGFDGTIFMCVQLTNGDVKWRARGYGSGQVLLVKPSGHLIILSETGDLSVVEAKPEKHTELSKIHAIDGKTWNHPVVADGKLFARNGVEMVCYELNPAQASAANPDAPAAAPAAAN